MFLERCYENRAIGLVAAFVVLITGAIATGAIATGTMAPAPVKAIDAAPRSRSQTLYPEARRADDCSSGLQCKCDTYC